MNKNTLTLFMMWQLHIHYHCGLQYILTQIVFEKILFHIKDSPNQYFYVVLFVIDKLCFTSLLLEIAWFFELFCMVL